MISLLDVNVLVALAWPNHVHHVAAHRWFRERTDGWSTTPLTETGFVRVSSNASAVPTAVRPIDALVALERMLEVGGHQFWPDPIPLVVAPPIEASRVLGHRQVVDAHLISLAASRDGCVATFDRGMRSLVDKVNARHVIVISSSS